MQEIKIAIIVLGVIAFIFSLLLAFLGKKLKVKDNPLVEKILSALPGLNCGACGFSSCHSFAEAAAKKQQIFSGCLPGGAEVNNKIQQIMGVIGNASADQRILICHCIAKHGEKKASSLYDGPTTCKAANITGGTIDCYYGCLGLGDCLKICPVDALSIEDGRITVDHDKCIRCGKCVKACPRNLFELIQLKNLDNVYSIGCNNPEKAIGVKKVCSRGCIGCGICSKVPNSPYHLKDNLSFIDYTKEPDLKALEEGKNKCPTKCISNAHAERNS